MSPLRKSLFTATLMLAVPLLVASTEKPDPGPPSWDAAPFTAEVTPRPAKEDWRHAQDVALAPSTPQHITRQCSARRLREWLRIHCEGQSIGVVRLLGGRRDGLETELKPSKEEFDDFPGSVDIVFPLRRGDVRVLEVLQISFGYKGSSSIAPWFVLSEHWPAEDDAPSLSLGGL